MASIIFNCRFCGLAGRHTTGPNGEPPSEDVALCDEPACKAKATEDANAAALQQAHADRDDAQRRIDALMPKKGARGHD